MNRAFAIIPLVALVALIGVAIFLLTREGERFNQALLERSRERVMRLGAFSQVQIAASSLGGEEDAVIEVKVVETPRTVEIEPAPSERNLRGRGQFLRMRNVARPAPSNAAPAKDEAPATLRVAAGLSVFWDSPFGPVQFDFAQPISVEAEAESGSARKQVGEG